MNTPPNANDPAQMQEFTQKLNELEDALRHADTALMGANTLRAKLTRAATRRFMAFTRKTLEWLATQKPVG